jgi:hypothetical protein
MAQVVHGVLGRHWLHAQAGVQPREQGLMGAQYEPVLQLGQADEDDTEQGPGCPIRS